MSGIWSHKFYDPKDLEKLTKIISAVEQNGSTIKRLRKPERSDVDEVLLRWFQQDRSGNVQYQ